jgi:hypothetical protein
VNDGEANALRFARAVEAALTLNGRVYVDMCAEAKDAVTRFYSEEEMRLQRERAFPPQPSQPDKIEGTMKGVVTSRWEADVELRILAMNAAAHYKSGNQQEQAQRWLRWLDRDDAVQCDSKVVVPGSIDWVSCILDKGHDESEVPGTAIFHITHAGYVFPDVTVGAVGDEEEDDYCEHRDNNGRKCVLIYGHNDPQRPGELRQHITKEGKFFS